MVKVFEEGEGEARKHGYSKRRTYRKVHFGMCADSGQVVVGKMNSNNASNHEATPHLIGNVIGDNAYHTTDCREAFYNLGGKQIIPPDKNAKLQRGKPLDCLKTRDEAIRRITELNEEGQAKRKQKMRYHRRSRVETLTYRYKTMEGERLSSWKESTQATEVAVKLDVLNRIIELRLSKNYKETC